MTNTTLPMMNIPTTTAKKWELYQEGIRRATTFLALNKINIPQFFTYEEAADAMTGKLAATRAFRMWKRLNDGPAQGTGTGWYKNDFVFVNLKRAANPVANPKIRSWSYPGYKTDRTPMGVVAHEVGHHADHSLRFLFDGHYPSDTWSWRRLILPGSNPVTSYEPVSSEAWAETLRLFILNPQMLELGSPRRYAFVAKHLKPSETRSWRDVLGQHPAYCAAAEKWFAKAK